MKKPRISLYCLRELHLPVLLPVYDALKKIPGLDLGFTAPVFTPGSGDRAEEGLRPETLSMLHQRGIAFWGDPEQERFECVITADACYDRIEGWGPVLCVGHGTISKNIYFIDEPSAYRENYSTVLCVPGPWYLQSFGAHLFSQAEATGFPKMDDFAKDWEFRKLAVFAEAGFDLNKKTLLFAPTYNPEFTGMDAFYKEWSKLDPAEYQVFFKLHGAADENWRRAYRELAASHSNMHYVEDPSLIPYMSMSDLMISDLSSAYVEYMVLDRPIVLFNNPQMQSSGLYNPAAIEFQVRDACTQIASPSELCPAIAQSFQQDPKGVLRKEYVQKLFPQMDGRICERVAEIARQIAVGERPAYPSYCQSLSIYIPDTIMDPAKILLNLARLQLPYRIFAHKKHEFLQGHSVQILRPEQKPEFPLAVLRGEFILSQGWDWNISLCLQFQQNVGIGLPMLAENDHNGIQQMTRLLNHRLEAPQGLLQAYAKYSLMHLGVDCEEGLWDGAYLGLEYAEHFAKNWFGQREIPNSLFTQPTHSKRKTILIGHYGF